MNSHTATWLIPLLTVVSVSTIHGALAIDHRSTRACLAEPVSCMQNSIDEQIAALSSIVVNEDVARYSSIGGKTRKIDSFDVIAEVIDGVESYSDVKRNGQSIADARKFPAHGLSGNWRLFCIAAALG